MRPRLRSVVVAAAVVLAACGSPSPTVDGPVTSTSVAAAECPASGVTVGPGVVDAASGFRAVALTLTVCGAAPVTVDGYPEVALLDAQGQVLDVAEVRGGTSIPDPGPVPLELAPGASARSVLSWRSTVTAGTPVEAAQVRVAPSAGAAPQTSPLLVDLGTTGRYELTAWAAAPA